MYGNFEYGSLIYGDASISILVVISRDEIAFIFVSEGKTFKFISPRQSNIFLSDTSEKKQFSFVSERKNHLFRSQKEG